MATRKPLRGLRHHARASLPDLMLSAGVAELVDALDLGSSEVTREGSSPSFRTIFRWPLGLRVTTATSKAKGVTFALLRNSSEALLFRGPSVDLVI